MPWMIVVILLTLLDKLSSEVACIPLADIYWNVTNPIFRIDNTDHIIDVNKGNTPFEYDQVNIICPVYPHRTSESDADQEDDTETYIIYNVSKDEYDSCRITNPNPKIIAVCDKPNQLMYFTITFRSFTPQPGGLEFLPGHDYYFVSTSTGNLEGLNQRVGGRCATNNMKVIFKVCCGADKGSGSSNGNDRQTSSDSTISSTSDSLPPSTTEVSKPYHRNIPYPPRHNHHHKNDPYLISSTSAIIYEVGATTSPTTPRWMRRPHYPLRVTPTTSYPYDEVPIDDEMARPSIREGKHSSRDRLPNKARSKNEELVNNGSSDESSGSVCWTGSSWKTWQAKVTLALQLLLTLLWR